MNSIQFISLIQQNPMGLILKPNKQMEFFFFFGNNPFLNLREINIRKFHYALFLKGKTKSKITCSHLKYY